MADPFRACRYLSPSIAAQAYVGIDGSRRCALQVAGVAVPG